VLKMIVTTIGLSIVIREAALLAWGESVRTLPFFSGNEVSSVSFLGAHFSPRYSGSRARSPSSPRA
jgi:branched-chain amino acid transport system permease protein